MSDPFATIRVGQSLLNAELTNGLAAKDAELHALKMAQVYAGNSGSTSDLKKKVRDLEAERNRIANSLKTRTAALIQSDVSLVQTRAALAEAKEGIEKRDVASMKSDLLLVKIEKELAEARNAIQNLNKSVDERDALVIEWMHSNEAFKRIARKYGEKLGLSKDQRLADFDNAITNISEEDPRFQKTELLKLTEDAAVKSNRP